MEQSRHRFSSELAERRRSETSSRTRHASRKPEHPFSRCVYGRSSFPSSACSLCPPPPPPPTLRVLPLTPPPKKKSEKERRQQLAKAVSAKIVDLEKEKAQAGNVVEQEEEVQTLPVFFPASFSLDCSRSWLVSHKTLVWYGGALYSSGERGSLNQFDDPPIRPYHMIGLRWADRRPRQHAH